MTATIQLRSQDMFFQPPPRIELPESEQRVTVYRWKPQIRLSWKAVQIAAPIVVLIGIILTFVFVAWYLDPPLNSYQPGDEISPKLQ
jgi:hypothetical protein